MVEKSWAFGRRCPKCGSLEILDNSCKSPNARPGRSAEEGTVVPDGCYVGGIPTEFKCDSCGHEFE